MLSIVEPLTGQTLTVAASATAFSISAAIFGLMDVKAGDRLWSGSSSMIIRSLDPDSGAGVLLQGWPGATVTTSANWYIEQSPASRLDIVATTEQVASANSWLARALGQGTPWAVVDRVSTPPAVATNGETYLASATASGGFEPNKIYRRSAGAWAVIAPRRGDIAFIAATHEVLGWDGAAWGRTGLTAAGGSLTGPLDWAAAVNVASAATVDLGAAASNLVNITGAVTIASFGSAAGSVWRLVRFAGALTLTRHATSMILPGGANIATAAGDTALLVSEGSGNWRCYWYCRADGTALVVPPRARTVRGDSNYTILSTDRDVAITVALTAPRTFTLPAANSVAANTTLTVTDEAGGVSAVNTLQINRAGADTINGLASRVLTTAFAQATFVSDGNSKWTTEVVAATASAASLQYNRFVNGAMQWSQQYVDTGLVGISASNIYAADQVIVGSVGPTITAVRVASPTPGGNAYRVRATVTTAKGSLAADDLLYISTPIEGIYTSDFKWGTAGAVPAILRFGFKGPAGTYCAVARNASLNRSWVGSFTVTSGQANTDTVQSLIIPGDTSGTWGTGNGLGVQLLVVLGCGSTFVGSAGWQAGNKLAISGVTNGGAALNTFELFDADFYPDLQGVGSARPYLVPDPLFELRRSLRYWEKGTNMGVIPGTATAATSLPWGDITVASMYSLTVVPFQERKRTIPTTTPIASNGAGNAVNYYNGTDWNSITTSVSYISTETAAVVSASVSNQGFVRFDYVANARLV